MAITSSFFAPADWFSTASGATRSVTGVSWTSGDLIIAIGTAEVAADTLSTPTNANLTSAAISGATLTTGTTTECPIYFWQATAGSTQTAQTISTTTTNSGHKAGIGVYVIRGGASVTNATTSRTEATISRTVSANSLVIYGAGDFSAVATNHTPATGSGTATERVDNGDGVTYGVHIDDWLGVSAGTFSFGLNSYTGMTITAGIIEVTAAAGATNTSRFFNFFPY